MSTLVGSAWEQLEAATARAEEAQGTIRRLDAQRSALESALSQQDAACKAAKSGPAMLDDAPSRSQGPHPRCVDHVTAASNLHVFGFH